MIRFLQTPGPIKKVVLGGLLTIISIFMVITLVPGFGSTDFFGTAPARGVVAKVAGTDVTSQEVQRQARDMLRQQFPRGGGAQTSMLLPFFASQAAQSLIQRQIIITEAERLGLHATDDDVRDELQHGRYSQAFFPGGNFIGQASYEEMLQQHDLTVPMFERGVKEEILIDKLRSLVAGGVTVTDAEVRQKFEKDNGKIKFDYAVLRKEDILKELHPTDPELKAFYDRNKANYNNSIPEKRKIKYVLIDSAKLQSEAQISQQDLQAYYDEHRDELRAPEQVNVRQILIKTPLPGPDGKVDQKGVDAARKKADDALQQLKAGAKFEDLAKKYSEDPSSKNGGSVGWIKRGGFPVPEVDKAAFSLPKGGTSDVINAGYAFVILRIDDKQEAHEKTLAEVKDQIEPTLKQQKAQQAADAMATAMLSQARSGGLDKAAAAKGMQVVTTDFFSRTDTLPGIGSSPQFTEAVFSAAEKSPPDQVQVSQGFAIFQLDAIKPAATPGFEEIRSRVETEFKNERAGTLLTQKTQELSDRAKADHDLKKAAKELGATMKSSDFVLPEGQVPDIGSMSTGNAAAAFGLKPGEISGPIDNETTGAVLAILEKVAPTDQDFAAKKDEIRDSLVQNKEAELFGLFLANLHDRMEKSGKIKINEQEMKSLTKQSGGEEGE
jgi:peptidyl-prolyl cis-trans isomerase D